MPNRQLRRAMQRATKKTHKLQPETCVVWVSTNERYIRSFSPGCVSYTEDANQAERFSGDDASEVANDMLFAFAMHAIVRNARGLQARHEQRCSSASRSAS